MVLSELRFKKRGSGGSREFQRVSYFRGEVYEETHLSRGENGSMQTSYVTELILKTSSSLLFVSRFSSVRFGARTFRVLAPFSVCPRGFSICSPRFPLSSRTVEHSRTIQRTFAERQKERNEARAKQVGNRGRKSKRQK